MEKMFTADIELADFLSQIKNHNYNKEIYYWTIHEKRSTSYLQDDDTI